MGFLTKEEVPPAPDMSPVVNAAKDIGAMSKTMAQDTMNWIQDQVTKSGGDISKFISSITSDSATARGMIQNFQDIANHQLGISDGALDIKDQALAQAARANNIADVQKDVQQAQLGVERKQLGVQDTMLQRADEFRGDQTQQQAKANQLYQQYAQVYDPAMARYMADAEAYGSPDRIAQARAGAAATVGDQFEGARNAAERQLQSYGIKPSEYATGALDLNTRLKEAATKAAAMETAQRETEAQAFALRNQAIQQGQQLPGQATAATNAATQIGSNVVGAGNTAVGAGNTAVGAAGAANTAGSNVIGATNAGTSALSAGTGATNAATAAGQGATQAQTGALAANTAAQTGTQAAGQLENQYTQTGANALGVPATYVSGATNATNVAGQTQNEAYKNQLAQFKAEQSNTSGLGAILGTVAGPVLKAALTGGASIPMDMASSALSNAGGEIGGNSWGGSASSPLAGLSASDYGSDASTKDQWGLAEGGAIPSSASPTNGQQVDDVPAQLTAGEFVMPRDVTAWYGEKFFQQLIQKAQNEKNKAGAKPAIGPATGAPPAVVSRPGGPPGPAIGAR